MSTSGQKGEKRPGFTLLPENKTKQKQTKKNAQNTWNNDFKDTESQGTKDSDSWEAGNKQGELYEYPGYASKQNSFQAQV